MALHTPLQRKKEKAKEEGKEKRETHPLQFVQYSLSALQSGVLRAAGGVVEEEEEDDKEEGVGSGVGAAATEVTPRARTKKKKIFECIVVVSFFLSFCFSLAVILF